jgi:polyhydroxybutyrate depolymerase
LTWFISALSVGDNREIQMHNFTRFHKITLAAVLAFPLFNITNVHACGPDTDCVLNDNRHYRISMPEGHDGKTEVGAIFFMHGYRGSAKGTMKNKSLAKAVSDLGLALVAPKAAYEDWAIPGAPSKHVPIELEYFEAVVKDINDRFSIDTSRMMASGFSAGGMMTWNLACDKSELFAAYAPIAGTFWEPTPKDCQTPTANIIHTHGTSDKIVPLAGRPIGDTKQGDVFKVLDMYAKKGDFKNARTYKNSKLGFDCNELKNDANQVLEVCLHSGGHSMKSAYVTNAWNKFVDLGIIK